MGSGPFPTEVHGDLEEELRREGAEYGTTTGRPRRVGWLDLTAVRYAARCAAVQSSPDAVLAVAFGTGVQM